MAVFDPRDPEGDSRAEDVGIHDGVPDGGEGLGAAGEEGGELPRV